MVGPWPVNRGVDDRRLPGPRRRAWWRSTRCARRRCVPRPGRPCSSRARRAWARRRWSSRCCDGAGPSARLRCGAGGTLATPAVGPFVDVTGELNGAAAEIVSRGARPYEVARALLDDLARQPGAVVVLEDLHWADDGSLDALAYLARRVQQVPALLEQAPIATMSWTASHGLQGAVWVAWHARGSAGSLHVQPLSRAGVEALARSAGRDGDAVFAATGGNPFFVTAIPLLCSQDPAQLRRRRRIWLAPCRWTAAGARGTARRAPRRSAAGGAVRCAPGARAWSRRPGAMPGGGHARGPRAGGCISPRVGASAPSEQECRTRAGGRDLTNRAHAAVLEEAGGEASHLVYHAEAAGDHEALRRHAVTAAARAAALGAHTEAAEHYERAIAVSGGRPETERAELLACSAQEHYLTNRANAAVIRQRDALALIRAGADPLREGDALRSLSRFHWFAGDGRAAEASGAEAVALLEGLDPSPELARAYSNLAQLRMLAHDTVDAIVWGERALELAERFDDTETAVHALTNVGSAGEVPRPRRAQAAPSWRRACAAHGRRGWTITSAARTPTWRRRRSSSDVFDEGRESTSTRASPIARSTTSPAMASTCSPGSPG